MFHRRILVWLNAIHAAVVDSNEQRRGLEVVQGLVKLVEAQNRTNSVCTERLPIVREPQEQA